MTREEAIQVLNTYDVNFDEYRAEEIAEAIDMAIEALEMQNNCIVCPRCGREFSKHEGRKQTNDK